MGKSLLLVLVVAACANNVPQDRSTGPDGKFAGAKELEIQEGAAIARGVVTYPGGDRVDWKKITLPEKATGKLDLQMTYTTPRPDLRVTFDVFDQYAAPLKQTVSGRGRNKTLSIADAKGAYYVRIYAQRRGDAGNYKLEAAFTPDPPPPPPMTAMVVPDPPKLPSIPEYEPPPTTCERYDAANPICKDLCAPGSPANHKPCAASTPGPVAPVIVTPPPPPPPKPIVARIVKTEVGPDGAIIIYIGAGSDTGVAKDWKTGSLLRGDTQSKLSGGNVTVIRVERRTTVAKLRPGMTSDVVNANANVILEP